MAAPDNKNTVELQEQDHATLKAIFERKMTLTEYAAEVGVSYGEAERMLADALRRKKTALTFTPARYNPPDGSEEQPRQGFRYVPRRTVEQPTITTRVSLGEFLADLEDLDDWMAVDQGEET